MDIGLIHFVCFDTEVHSFYPDEVSFTKSRCYVSVLPGLANLVKLSQMCSKNLGAAILCWKFMFWKSTMSGIQYLL